MSRKLLHPELITVTGVRPSSVRSADISIEFSPPRCTPPSPPVAKIFIPERCASIIVPAIVVPPLCFRPIRPWSSQRVFPAPSRVHYHPTGKPQISAGHLPSIGAPSTRYQVDELFIFHANSRHTVKHANSSRNSSIGSDQRLEV